VEGENRLLNDRQLVSHGAREFLNCFHSHLCGGGLKCFDDIETFTNKAPEEGDLSLFCAVVTKCQILGSV
jgi:hypothetical protein